MGAKSLSFFKSENPFVREKSCYGWAPTTYLSTVFFDFVFRSIPLPSQAPTYPFPWGSTNEPVRHKSLAQFEITVNPFESYLFICDCHHRLGLTYIAFKWLWVVVLQWISHDVQFCSKRKMGSSLRFYAQFLTLAPSMNKNLCSFCGCSLLNGVSVDFQQGFRVLDSSQLAFVSTHKRHCSFPAFDTFTPDHFASCCCVQLLWTDFQNLKLTVDHILLTFGREHSFFWVVFPASWEFRKKSRWKHDCWLFDSFFSMFGWFLAFFLPSFAWVMCDPSLRHRCLEPFWLLTSQKMFNRKQTKQIQRIFNRLNIYSPGAPKTVK